MDSEKRIATAEDVHYAFTLFKENMTIIQRYDELIYADKDRDKWIKNYKKRSEATRKAYADNADLGVFLAPFLTIPLRLPMR